MLKIGDQYKEDINYDQNHVVSFAELTGDKNPLHLDENFAALTQFKKPIMHGMIGSCLLSKIFATNFPGIGSVFLSHNLKFKRPMFAGKNYQAIVIVTEINSAKHIGTISSKIIDTTNNKICISAESEILNNQQF